MSNPADTQTTPDPKMDEVVRHLALRMAQETGCSIRDAEYALRRMLDTGLIDLGTHSS